MRDPTATPVLSVVVPCRGHARELQSCLQGIVRQTVPWPYEIIVVDSALDTEVAAVAGAVPGVKLIRSRSPLYAGDARNLGAGHARAGYVAFIDADAIPEPGWMTAAVAALDSGAIMVSGPILDLWPLHPFAMPDNLLQFVEFSPGRPEGPAEHFASCHLAIRRTAFLTAGRFPTDMPVGEDVAFTHEVARRWPAEVRFVRAMRVRHRGRTGLRSYWEHQYRLGYYRGRLGQHVHPILQTLGALPGMEIAISAKRFLYVVRRSAQWNRSALLRLLVLWPGLLYGVTAFASGFRRGCREADGRRR